MTGRTLVIDTATAACSVALIEAGAVVGRAHAVVGRGHAEQLVPMIATLPDGGRAARILVDVGPGSFTGLRVGIAAARGLALGWRARATGYSSTVLLAAARFAIEPERPLAVVLEGGHGEVFMQAFDSPSSPLGRVTSLRPEAALAALDGRFVIGSGLRWLRAVDDDVPGEDALADAADAVLLAASDVALPPSPLYGRAPDAKPAAAR